MLSEMSSRSLAGSVTVMLVSMLSSKCAACGDTVDKIDKRNQDAQLMAEEFLANPMGSNKRKYPKKIEGLLAHYICHEKDFDDGKNIWDVVREKMKEMKDIEARSNKIKQKFPEKKDRIVKKIGNFFKERALRSKTQANKITASSFPKEIYSDAPMAPPQRGDHGRNSRKPLPSAADMKKGQTEELSEERKRAYAHRRKSIAFNKRNPTRRMSIVPPQASQNSESGEMTKDAVKRERKMARRKSIHRRKSISQNRNSRSPSTSAREYCNDKERRGHERKRENERQNLRKFAASKQTVEEHRDLAHEAFSRS